MGRCGASLGGLSSYVGRTYIDGGVQTQGVYNFSVVIVLHSFAVVCMQTQGVYNLSLFNAYHGKGRISPVGYIQDGHSPPLMHNRTEFDGNNLASKIWVVYGWLVERMESMKLTMP